MSTQPRDAVFHELDALIQHGWGDVPRRKIPENWREIIAERYDLVGLIEEAAIPAVPIPSEVDRGRQLAQVLMANEKRRRSEAERIRRKYKPRLSRSERLARMCAEMKANSGKRRVKS